MPAKRIIILNRSEANGTDPIRVQCVFWADVPVNFQPFYLLKPTIRSAWDGATGAENTAILNGQVAEKSDTIIFDTGTTLNQARTQLENRWTNFQDKVTNQNPAISRGAYFDGDGSWHNKS
jgi:hypothetical protein